MSTLPYAPTWVGSAFPSSDLVYMVRPSYSDPSSSELIAINTSATLSSANLSLNTITSPLPFAKGGQDAVIIPAMDDNENLLVLTGDCLNGTDGAILWQFVPDKNSGGSWRQVQLTRNDATASRVTAGANHLAAAFMFSGTTETTAELHVFGGMCPNATASTPTDWVRNAVYSDSLLDMRPDQESLSSATTTPYELGISLSRGPPVAEAGFTITPLEPTLSEANDNQSRSQNQNFVFVGGHTQQAFINMSQVALYSLPEETWSFIPVTLPSGQPNTDLAAREAPSIDSRSGHSAVLAPDGKKVVVFGGWVGDVTNMADPQLVILELGQGYGGDGDWHWTIPSPAGSGPAINMGIYGHGATMLAGDVMLIIGGYQIPPSGSTRRKRASLMPNTDQYFLNTTSNAWIPKYTNPKLSSMNTSTDVGNPNSDLRAERAGLGVGLTLGILAVIAIVILYFWYSRRLRRRREARAEELRRLATSAQRHHFSDHSRNNSNIQPEMTAVDWAADWRPGVGVHVQGSRETLTGNVSHEQPEAERTGMLFEIPSPTRGLRRSLHSRGSYQPTPRYDEGRRGVGLGTIHPIDEREEYDQAPSDEKQADFDNDIVRQQGYDFLNNAPVLDPFRDPEQDSRTPSPQSPQEREAEIRGWVNDWTAAEAIMASGGRVSPEKTDRTSSTLSEQSAHSYQSARSLMSHSSMQQSLGTISRTLSQRSAQLFSNTPYRLPNAAPQDFQRRGSARSQYSADHRRSRSLNLSSGQQIYTGHPSSSTGQRAQQQTLHEDDLLLGDHDTPRESSPSKVQRRTRGWIGSFRRSFVGAERNSSSSPDQHEASLSSPTEDQDSKDGLPRRATSTGGMFWQKRQGEKDWQDGDRDHIDGSVAKEQSCRKEGHDEDWDVESAVEKRVVQVMFTVPKEKLRVVNRGPDEEADSMLSSRNDEASNDIGDGVLG